VKPPRKPHVKILKKGEDFLSKAKPAQVERYQKLKIREAEVRAKAASGEFVSKDKGRKYIEGLNKIKPIDLDLSNPAFPKVILAGFEAELAARERAAEEKRAAAIKKANAAAEAEAEAVKAMQAAKDKKAAAH